MDTIGKYQILEEIGKGGMGIVYKAFDATLHRTVAIKMISESFFQILDSPRAKERFYAEARLAAKLSHENITIIHDVGEENNLPYIVMEYLNGIDLRHVIRNKLPLTLLQKLNYATQICHGLRKAHVLNVIHRDVKPENIMIVEGDRIKIMDFGIAKILSENRASKNVMSTVIGTVEYMSPEQRRGDMVDGRADIFSLGIVLYELITYKKPTFGTTVDTGAHEYAIELEEMILKCLENDVKDRFKSIDAVLERIESIRSRLAHDSEQEGVLPKPGQSVHQMKEMATTYAPPGPEDKEITIVTKTNYWPLIAAILIVAGGLGWFFVVQPMMSSHSGAGGAASNPVQAAMLELKNDALADSSDVYAPDLFERAEGLEREGNQAVAAGDDAAGREAYRRASNAYRQAINETEIEKIRGRIDRMVQSLYEEKDHAEQSVENVMDTEPYAQARRYEDEALGLIDMPDRESLSEALRLLTESRDRYVLLTQRSSEVDPDPGSSVETTPVATDQPPDDPEAGSVTDSPPVAAPSENASNGTRALAEQNRQVMIEARTRVPGDAVAQDRSSLFAQAASTETRGESHLQAGRHEQAAAAFEEATALYTRAAENIRQTLRAEAENARTDMLDVKASVGNRTETNAPFQEGLQLEQNADDALRSNTFQEATSLYAQARRKYTEAKQEETRIAASEEQAQLESFVDATGNRIVSSFENMSIDQLGEIVTLDDDDVRAWTYFFNSARDVKVAVQSENMTRLGDTTYRIDLVMSIEYLDNRNRPQQSSMDLTGTLNRVNGQWTVDALAPR